jgi:choline-glycine betaine transporter
MTMFHWALLKLGIYGIVALVELIGTSIASRHLEPASG